MMPEEERYCRFYADCQIPDSRAPTSKLRSPRPTRWKTGAWARPWPKPTLSITLSVTFAGRMGGTPAPSALIHCFQRTNRRALRRERYRRTRRAHSVAHASSRSVVDRHRRLSLAGCSRKADQLKKFIRAVWSGSCRESCTGTAPRQPRA